MTVEKQNMINKLSLQFANYFKFPKNGIFQAAPVISIEHKSKFSVSEYYLEEFHNVAPRVVSKTATFA